MFCLKDKPSAAFILTTLILVILPLISSPGVAGASGVILNAAAGESNNGGNKTSLVLAKERTHRKDPADSLNYYTGGWNISDPHYIASVVYTGFPLFFISLLWLVVFGVFLLVGCICSCCRKGRHSYGYSPLAYTLSLIFLILFTIAAIAGSVVLYTGQENFNRSTIETMDYVIWTADSTSIKLRNVSDYLTHAKNVTVNSTILPPELQNKIDQVNVMITKAADMLSNATRNNEDKIFNTLNAVRLTLIIVAAVMLFLALLGFLLSILGLQCLVHVLVVLSWLLVAMTFILGGIFVVLHNVMGDSCVAMNEWVVNPTANTALDDIIPCVDPLTAQSALSESKNVTYKIVDYLNILINNSVNLNPPPNLPPFSPDDFAWLIFYNQSGPMVPLLCNPYNADLTNRTCASAEVDLSNATQVWKNYTCHISNNQCRTVGRLTPFQYSHMTAAVTVGYGLYQYSPFLTGLVDCTFVRDTFTSIHVEHCPELTLFSKWVYIGLVLVSVAVMLSLVLWMLYARERRHRKYAKLEEVSSYRSSFQDKN